MESPLRCNDRPALSRALQEGRQVAFQASTSEVHVWATDEPSDDDRCRCGARRWGFGSGAPSRGGATSSPTRP